MGKKNLTKTESQRQGLEVFYKLKKGIWTRDSIIQFSRRIGLSRQQVYKWLWDRRNQEKPKSSNQQQNSQQKDFSKKENNWQTFYYKRFQIQIPKSKQRVSCFYVNPKISRWAINVLRFEGWQLIRDSNLQNIQKQFYEKEDESLSNELKIEQNEVSNRKMKNQGQNSKEGYQNRYNLRRFADVKTYNEDLIIKSQNYASEEIYNSD